MDTKNSENVKNASIIHKRGVFVAWIHLALYLGMTIYLGSKLLDRITEGLTNFGEWDLTVSSAYFTISLLAGISSVLLLVGIFKKNTLLFWPWFTSAIICIIWMCMLLAIGWIGPESNYEGQFLYILFLVFQTYTAISIYVLYKDLNVEN